MIYCHNCGEVAENAVMPPTYRNGLPTKDEFPTCPACGSDDIDEAVRCKLCGEYTASVDLSSGVCPKCEVDLRKRLDAVLMHEFTADEIEAMRDLDINF